MQSYIEIANEITADIFLNAVAEGERIASIPQLCRKYKASDKTIQKALKKLKEEGILFSRPGEGVFVKDRKKLNADKTFLKIAVLDIGTREFIDDIICRFEKSRSGIKVLWKEFPFGFDLNDLMRDYLPDIVMFEESNIHRFMSEDIWENLEDPCFRENTYPNLLAGVSPSDRLYAAPVLFSPVLVEYNKKLAMDAGVAMPSGWDMNLFTAIAEKLTKKSPPRKTFGFVLSLSLFRFPALIAAFGGKLQNLPGSMNAITKFLALSSKLIEKGISPYIPEENPGDNCRFCYMEGYGAMRLGTYVGLRKREKFTFDWDLMPLPKADKNGSSAFVANYAGILKGCRNKIFAADFMKYLYSDEIQELLKKEYFHLPARKDICEDETIVPATFCPENYHVFKRETRNMQSLCSLFQPRIKSLFSNGMFMFFNRFRTLDEVICSMKEELK